MTLSGAPLLVLASYIPAAMVARESRSRALVWSFVLVVTLLNCISLWNVIAWPIPGAQWDAQTFHKVAWHYAHHRHHHWPRFSLGTKVYETILVVAYRILGADRWVGQSLSVSAASLSLLLIFKLARENGVENIPILCGLILGVGLFPPFLFHGALTFREPFELLGLVVGCYFSMRALRQVRLLWLLPASLGFLFMGLFHHVLLAVSFMLIAVFVAMVFLSIRRSRREYGILLALLAVTVVVGVAAFVSVPVTSRNDYFSKVMERGSILRAVAHYRHEVEERSPRTSYNVALDPDSLPRSMAALGLDYVSYLFRPYYTDIEEKGDIVPFVSSLARLLLVLAIVVLIMLQRSADRTLLAIGAVYLLLTAVWSVGTTNYGQAFRHHSMTDWLLCLAVARLLAARYGKSPESHAG